jgi:hypothetical protein
MGSAVVVSVATPLNRWPGPRGIAPLKKLTSSPSVVVVGGPTVKGLRVAVKVTESPANMDEAGEDVRVSVVFTGAAVSGTVSERLPR